MTINRNILISGAGIAGLTLAYWLKRHGFAPTVIEKRPNLDDQGYMIDFYGSGYDVAEMMGLLDRLKEKSDRYPISRLEFVDRDGKPRAILDVEKFRTLLDHRYFPLMRGDLESTVHETVREGVSVRFGISIKSLKNLPDRVDVEFSDGTAETFDLVIGAGGIHSNVRRLLWGEERQFRRFLGLYVACSVMENFLDTPQAFFGHFEPGTQTTVYSIGNNRLAVFFAFRSQPLDVGSRAEQLEELSRRFGNQGWIVPHLVSGTRQADDFFFDAVAQIHLEEWHRGRVALVGDACQCLTLLAGQGASMAMAGAYLLADELARAGGHHEVAFPAYQRRLQPEVLRRQKDARGLAGSFVPQSNFAISMTYLFLNAAFLPGFRTLFAKQIGAGSIFK